MRRKKNRSIILLLFCLCLAMVLGGEGAKAALDVKIGYVDYARIFWETEKTRELLAKLELEKETDLRILSERRQVTEKEIDARTRVSARLPARRLKQTHKSTETPREY